MPVIEEIVSKIEDWRGKQISISTFSGGLTNTNYKVEVDRKALFLFVCRAKAQSFSQLIGITNTSTLRAAAEAGVGPKVLYYLTEYQAMVLEFIDGTTMTKEALNAQGMPTRMAQAIKKLHAGPRFLTDFNMFRLTEYYLKICRDRAIPMPEGYLDRMPAVTQIEKAMSVQPLPTVPCNNDLLAENYMDDGKVIATHRL